MLYFQLIIDFIYSSYHFKFLTFFNTQPIPLFIIGKNFLFYSFIVPQSHINSALRLFKRWTPINRMVPLQLIKWINIMIDNSDIPLPADELKSRVLVFAITDEATHEYEEITKGYVELSTDEDDKNNTFHYLEVKDENSNEVLMRSNLKLQNNFGKQKGSIISWTDQQQPQYQQIALSFQKDRECDMFWRVICEKIGKSYLQINGTQKLQTPNINNLNSILQKAKNSIDLIDYNIVHSKSIMQGLRQVFYEMKNTNDQMGMGTILRIINAIMCPAYSSNAIQNMLTGENFYLLLDLQQFKKNINFTLIYQQKVGQYLKNKFCLSNDIFQKIELCHRATFYRQNVLDLSQDNLLESMMFMICKEAQVQIVSYLNRAKFLQNLIKLTEYPKCQQLTLVDDNNKNDQLQPLSHLDNDKIHFIHEALIIYQQITSQQIKITFKQSIYTSGILQFIKAQIQNNNPKALEILYCVNEIDRLKFFEFLIQEFKQSSSDNLLKTLMKKYINEPILRSSILALIEVMTPLFNEKKELFDFFNGTFVFSVFSVAKDSSCILSLANVLLSLLQNSSVLFGQFVKLRICERMASEYRSGTSLKKKSEELQILKFLKYITIEQIHKGQGKNKEIQKNVIESGLFDCCMMIFFKHSLRNNVISSSMLQNLRVIERMDYSEFDAYLIKQYSTNESLGKILEPIRKKHIQFINKKQTKINDLNYLQVQRMFHEEILQNEHQESYLMNDDHETTTSKDINHLEDNFQNKQIGNLSENSPVKKQDSLQFLKRMMSEISEVKDQAEGGGQRQPRKMIKKSEDSKETNIEFSFDLPDMDQIDRQLKDT